MPFVSDVFAGFDLAAAVRSYYGPSATLVQKGDHLYDWKAVVNGNECNIDLNRAAQEQGGSSCIPAAIGVHAYDWKILDTSKLVDCVFPVMIVAKDLMSNIADVRSGIAAFGAALEATQSFYQSQVGRSFRLIQPAILDSGTSAREWDDIQKATLVPANDPARWSLLNAAVGQFKSTSFPRPVENDREVVLAPLTLISDNADAGAASMGDPGYVAVPAAVTTSACETNPSSPSCIDAVYAIGHELGHCFGLNHPCPDPTAKPPYVPFPPPPPGFSSCGTSIMQHPSPGPGILHRYEADWLKANCRHFAAGLRITAVGLRPKAQCVLLPGGPAL